MATMSGGESSRAVGVERVVVMIRGLLAIIAEALSMRRREREDHGSPIGTVDGVDLTEAMQVLRRAGYPEPLDGLQTEKTRIEYVLRALCELTSHDGLTGLLNARHFKTVLEQEVERSFRTGQPCSLLLMDLDHFKAVNDRHGHVAGDQVLQSVGSVIKAGTRTMDTAARYGGEEFAVILPNTAKASAVMIAERLRSKVARQEISYESSVIPVTCSIGVACLNTRIRHTGLELIKMADVQLYRAKSLGRNRMCSDERPSLSVSRDERMALSRGSFTAKERT